MKEEMDKLMNECAICTRCELHKGRRTVVVGKGSLTPKIMFIGEGPGEQEDKQGEPFVGKAGKLLDLLFEAMEFSKEDYYTANVVKCRPPANRVPEDQEANTCLPYLRKQVQILKPQILVCLGSTALKYIVDKESKITNIRGTIIQKKNTIIIPTYHPDEVLRDESKKIDFWNDMKKVKIEMEKLCIE